MKSIIEIAKSGLRASQRSMSVTSNNITNANTDGYSRQRVEMSPDGMRMNQGHVGLGVNIDQVSRLRDEMNDQLLSKKQQDMGYLQKKADIYEKIESTMISDSGDDLDAQIGGLFDNFSELASNPQDESVRNNLISESQQLTSKLRETNRSLDQNSELVKGSADQTLDSINTLLRDIDELNSSIKHGEAVGEPDFASLDKRVAKMSELSELVEFESRETSSGAVEIQIDGHNVVDENEVYHISSEVDDVNKNYRLRLESGHVISPDDGQIRAEIEMYEEGIPEMQERLDNIAETLVSEVNSLHNAGYSLEDNVSRSFFDPTGTTADSISVNQNLVDNPNLIAASDALDGTGKGEAGNGEIASQIADLRHDGIIGNSQTLSNYTISTISEPGIQLDATNNRIDARDSEIQMLKTQQEQEAGVNIDEELSNMIKHQNAYQGAAKVMSSAQQMYDTLLSLVR